MVPAAPRVPKVPNVVNRVPNVVNQTEGQAVVVLSDAGLRIAGPSNVIVSCYGSEPIVVNQVPQAGTPAHTGGQVSISLGCRLQRSP